MGTAAVPAAHGHDGAARIALPLACLRGVQQAAEAGELDDARVALADVREGVGETGPPLRLQDHVGADVLRLVAEVAVAIAPLDLRRVVPMHLADPVARQASGVGDAELRRDPVKWRSSRNSRRRTPIRRACSSAFRARWALNASSMRVRMVDHGISMSPFAPGTVTSWPSHVS